MPYRFIIFTWLLIIPLHTLLTAVALTVINPTGGGIFDLHSTIGLDQLASIAIFSLPFTLPGLFGLLLLVWIAKEFLYDCTAQFLFITVGCIFITLCCYFMLEFLLNLDLNIHEYFPLVIASVLAVLIALSLTRKYYYSYYRSLP